MWNVFYCPIISTIVHYYLKKLSPLGSLRACTHLQTQPGRNKPYLRSTWWTMLEWGRYEQVGRLKFLKNILDKLSISNEMLVWIKLYKLFSLCLCFLACKCDPKDHVWLSSCYNPKAGLEN